LREDAHSLLLTAATGLIRADCTVLIEPKALLLTVTEVCPKTMACVEEAAVREPLVLATV